MAFWDRRAAHLFERWMTGGEPHAELDDDLVNDALEELHKAIEPRIALRLAIEAAVRADAAVSRLPDAISGQLIGERHDYLLRRSEHRSEHLDQIEAALGRAA
ncbi:hypothetical protein BH23CHL7_BH23CHL7_03210 [soil metagenome]